VRAAREQREPFRDRGFTDIEAFSGIEQGRWDSQHLQKNAETDDDNQSDRQRDRLTRSTTRAR
jgi:hypothetical protein